MKHAEFVMLEKVNKKTYPEYAQMSASERKSLPATNFWRLRMGLEPIPVPPEDEYYQCYFTPPEEVNYLNTPRKKKPQKNDQ